MAENISHLPFNQLSTSKPQQRISFVEERRKIWNIGVKDNRSAKEIVKDTFEKFNLKLGEEA